MYLIRYSLDNGVTMTPDRQLLRSSCSVSIKQLEHNILDSRFHTVDSGFQVLDS